MTTETDRHIREFGTGATRDDDTAKLDYEGFLSPTALRVFAEYMDKHRHQLDGTTRGSDNWQAGIPKVEYMKSLLRHVMDAWLIHRGRKDLAREALDDALCGILFNTFGYLYELHK